jgi:ankyrin repeat protein
MSPELPSGRTLDSLKKEAKRWLKALRANVDDARARLQRALHNAPPLPTLRDVQHALALEHGFPGWKALKEKLAAGTHNDETRPNPVDWFLENACPDHHVRGGPSHVQAANTAMRLLDRFPEIAHDGFTMDVVLGDLARVRTALTADPSLAMKKRVAEGPDRTKPGDDDGNVRRNLGPKRWEPLLFLAFTRLSRAETNDNAVAIARELLDRGADPTVFFMAGHSRYRALVGVIGEGEEDRPPHPRRDELVRLLLDRGAEPYDIQVIYNIHFHGKILWFLEVIHEHSVKLGRAKDWDDPDWSMLNMGNYGSGARWHLNVAVDHNDLELAEWVLAHGASPNAGPPVAKTLFQGTLYEKALRNGFTQMADLLVRYGATPVDVALDPGEALTAAALRLDGERARTIAREHPDALRSHKPLFAAANLDRPDAAALLLDLGMSPDVEDHDKHRPLHMAAYAGSLRVAELLIERGAEIDPVAKAWNNTPIGAANYSQHPKLVELIGKRSRDIWELTVVGNVERLRELFRENPERARTVSNGYTPLMWLPPANEEVAIQIAELYLTNGADASLEDNDGRTAADRAETMGMFRVAAMLRSATTPGRLRRLEDYESAADALLDAYRTGTPAAMERLYRYVSHRRTWEAMRTYVQLDLGKRPAVAGGDVEITLDDVRFLVARGHGFESWAALGEYLESIAERTSAVAARPVTPYFPDEPEERRRRRSTRDWDAAIALMRDERIPALDAHEQMTDAILDRIADLDHVTTLKLDGSKQLTDAGLRHLVRMPQLRELEVGGTAISDAGLEVLRSLPELRRFSAWRTRVTDRGAARLAHCPHLERVDLAFTASGDGAIAALAGRESLTHLRTGNGVTDSGLTRLHDIPVFKTWHGGDVVMGLTSYDSEPNNLMLRGPFTDAGLANLVGLEGLFGLNVDASELAITAEGLRPLVEGLPNLGWLAFDADDEAMRYIGQMPRLRFLGCQDTNTGDDGWVSLGASRSIEYIWGRRCYNLRGRGFTALASMPALRALSVSCKNVDDSALALLPSFPSLTELMPMDVPDEGYRHIGRCERLESLVLMYCRDTTDRATERIAGLANLKSYFASYTLVTDRTPEILAGISSLETIGLSAIPGITNTGIAALARLPRLRELDLGGLRNVTPEITTVFSPQVRVHYHQ